MRRIAAVSGIVLLVAAWVAGPVGADSPPTHRVVDANGDTWVLTAPYKVKEVQRPVPPPPRKPVTHMIIDADRVRIEVAAPYAVTPIDAAPPTSSTTTTIAPPTTTAPPGGAVRFSGSVSVPAGFTVPAGHSWAFDPATDTTVTVEANVIVTGVLEMRPNPGVSHVLRFAGVDEDAMVGGGMHPIDSDVGLWVVGDGRLDAAGEPRTGWNRTGSDPTWKVTDELVVAPGQPADACAFSRYAGGPVPRLDAAVPPAEVVNLTRTVRIEGTRSGRSHIFIRSTEPQRITHASIRWMGPDVTGRYPLHLHHMGDASRGSLIEGVVVRDSGDHAFVIHGSHGVTLRDTVAYDVVDDAYWWDSTRGGMEHNATDDIVYDHAFAGKLRPDPDHPYNLAGFRLGAGSGGVVRDSAAVCIEGPENGAGFAWPAGDVQAWDFDDNVAHHNRNGITVWHNDSLAHMVSGFVAYANRVGIDHGAYANGFSYDEVLLYRNGTGIELHAAGRSNATWTCITERASTSGIALEILRSNSARLQPVDFVGADLQGKVVNHSNGQTTDSRVTFTPHRC